jgi:hypothetical protein
VLTWLIFVDDLHIDFPNTGGVRDLLRSISTTAIRDDDVVAMRAPGPSSMAIGPTSDRTIVDGTIRRVYAAALPPIAISQDALHPGGEIDARLTLTFSAASMLLDSVPPSPDHRVVMIYISNGYESEPGRALASLFASAARQAHVTICAVNAAGFGSVEDRRVDPAFWKQVLTARRQSLRALGDGTDGFTLLGYTDAADAMSRLRVALPGRR